MSIKSLQTGIHSQGSVGGQGAAFGQRFQPTTRTAYLSNSQGDVTKHIWWCTETKKDGTHVHWFRCCSTYELRIWGVDGPPDGRDPR